MSYTFEDLTQRLLLQGLRDLLRGTERMIRPHSIWTGDSQPEVKADRSCGQRPIAWIPSSMRAADSAASRSRALAAVLGMGAGWALARGSTYLATDH